MKTIIGISIALLCFFAASYYFEQRNTHPMYQLVKLLSRNHPQALKDIDLYIKLKSVYANKYEDRLAYFGYELEYIDDVSEIDDITVLVEILDRNHRAALADHREVPDSVLTKLNRIADGRLSECPNYQELLLEYQQSEYNQTYYIARAPKASSLYQCFYQKKLQIIAIDDGSDSPIYAMINIEDLRATIKFAEKSKVDIFVFTGEEIFRYYNGKVSKIENGRY